MNRVKRWTTAMVARLDQVLAQVENHEALAESVIRDVRRAAARAKVQLARVRQDGERLSDDLEQQREACLKWRERARQCASDDEARALECLRRSRRAAAVVPELERRLTAHREMETRLSADVDRVEDRLNHMASQHNLMRTRQSRAEALTTARSADSVGDLSDVFDRWEIQITELELDGDLAPTLDPLASEFEGAEEDEALREELARLLGEAAPAVRESNHV